MIKEKSVVVINFIFPSFSEIFYFEENLKIKMSDSATDKMSSNSNVDSEVSSNSNVVSEVSSGLQIPMDLLHTTNGNGDISDLLDNHHINQVTPVTIYHISKK